MNFRNIIVLYFIVGAVMWAGGAINWNNAGVGQFIITANDNSVAQNGNATQDLTEIGGPIEEAASNVDGLGLLAVWNLIVGLLGYLTWPITVLQSRSAPIEIVVLLGGTLQMTFFVAVIGLVRRSA